MSGEPLPAPDPSEVLVLVDGMTPGMPLGPALSFTDPPLSVSVYGGAERPPDPVWAGVPIVSFADVCAPVQRAIERLLAEHVGDEPWPERRPPWFRCGWSEHAQEWIDEQLHAANVVRRAPLVPARVWSLSAVLRVPLTDGTEVWFKATCDHFGAEPSITRAIGAWGGSAVPTVLASDDDRAWMLLAPLPPTALDSAGRVEATAAAMSKLQLESIDHVGALLASGCPDRGLRPTLDAFGGLLAERGRAGVVLPWVEDRLGAFFGSGVPLTLVHGDLHLENVAGDDDPVIFDWSDGCISHPFIDGAHLADRAGASHREAIRAAYLAAWGEYAKTAWDLAPLADLVFQAVTYAAIGRSLEPASRWETAGALERLLSTIEHHHAAQRDRPAT